MKCAYHPEVDAMGSCVSCGRLVCEACETTLGGKLYCQPCADHVFTTKPAGRVSGFWWLAPILLTPIFLSWLGGLIAWLVNKDTDPRTARNMLALGLVLLAAWILLLVLI